MWTPPLLHKAIAATRGPYSACTRIWDALLCCCVGTLKTHGVRTETEVLIDLSGVLGSSEKDGVAALGCSEGELVEGEALAAGSLDALAGGAGEAESGDAQLLLQVDQTDIVGDGADDDDGVLGRVGLAVGNLTADPRNADGSSVGAALVQSAEDGLVEFAVGSSSEEAVELDPVDSSMSILDRTLKEGKTNSKRR